MKLLEPINPTLRLGISYLAIFRAAWSLETLGGRATKRFPAHPRDDRLKADPEFAKLRMPLAGEIRAEVIAAVSRG